MELSRIISNTSAIALGVITLKVKKKIMTVNTEIGIRTLKIRNFFLTSTPIKAEARGYPKKKKPAKIQCKGLLSVYVITPTPIRPIIDNTNSKRV